MILNDPIMQAEQSILSKQDGDRKFCVRYKTYNAILDEYIFNDRRVIDARVSLERYMKLISTWFKDDICNSRRLLDADKNTTCICYSGQYIVDAKDLSIRDLYIRDTEMLDKYRVIDSIESTLKYNTNWNNPVDIINITNRRISINYCNSNIYAFVRDYIKFNNITKDELYEDYEYIKNILGDDTRTRFFL